MSSPLTVGDDHCRVTQPDADSDIDTQFEYCRHLFAYQEIGRRVPSGAQLLEVGCGAGYGTNVLARAAGNVTATDPSADAIAYARSRYPSLNFVQTSDAFLPFDDSVFDVVVSLQVIEHINDVRSYLQEIHRVLRPEGSVILTTPNRRLRLFPFQRPWNPYHVREYSDRQIRSLVSSFFPSVELLGVMTRQDLLARERSRVNRNRIFKPFSPLLSLARFMRDSFRSSQRTREVPHGHFAADQNDTRACSVEEFYLSSDTRKCLDLFLQANKKG